MDAIYEDYLLALEDPHPKDPTMKQCVADAIEELRREIKGEIRVGHHYDKCDSPLERTFQHYLLKFAHELTKIHRQFKVTCGSKIYRLDFALERNGRIVGIECDGKEFHDINQDSERDKAIISTGLVNRIIRLPGKDIHHCRWEVILILNAIEPSFWNDRISNNEMECHPIEDSWIRQDSPSKRTGYAEIVWRYHFNAERFPHLTANEIEKCRICFTPTIVYFMDRPGLNSPNYISNLGGES